MAIYFARKLFGSTKAPGLELAGGLSGQVGLLFSISNLQDVAISFLLYQEEEPAGSRQRQRQLKINLPDSPSSSQRRVSHAKVSE